MATGLLALFDDIATIAQVAAASLDDTAAAAAKAGVKAAGVVIDDTAVTPRYVTGFAASRELPMVAKIAWGSLRNKLIFLLPAGLALSAAAPWAIMPLLMAGGAYLCFEGAEKIAEALGAQHSHEDENATELDPAAQEKLMVAGAIRTDLILSAEIMAITLASVADKGLIERAIVMAVVGAGITVAVYGVVGLIVKADDLGVILAKSRLAALRIAGRGLVGLMPPLLRTLSAVGTAAMLWVGGGIIVHGLEEFHFGEPARLIHECASAAGHIAGPVLEWATGAACSGILGTVIGSAILAIFSIFHRPAAAH